MSITLQDHYTKRRVVAIGNDQLWYEDIDMPGTMIKLDASDGDIDTTDQLELFSAFQKGFVVNGANLKIADFTSVKLVHSALTTPPEFGALLRQDQGGGNIAWMTVDYVNPDKTETYGFAYYEGDATEFTTSHTVEDTSGEGNSFTPSEVVNPPHWRDWTVFQGDEEKYGEMPDYAYLGCLYRGRAVLSGNPVRPYQWYMSRQNAPYDFAYFAGDAQSAVSGGNADAGQLGDVIRALIPHQDDYLIFGCASSVWVLFGDPASGGELRELSNTTGIFGARSFCWDSQNILYFWGDGGLYRTQVPGKPQLISHSKLPQLVKEEGASPRTHRISLAYDAERNGIQIAIVKSETGESSNYWYDLTATGEDGVGAFFPEEYPVECSVYSSMYYNSNDPDLKGLIMGCTDGRIRTFDELQKSDDVDSETTEPIDSEVLLGPMAAGDGVNRTGVIGGINLIVGGDSDDVDYSLITSRTSEDIIDQARNTMKPKAAGTFRGPGTQRGMTRRQMVRDMYLGIMLGNNNLDESWAFEKLAIDVRGSGRRK